MHNYNTQFPFFSSLFFPPNTFHSRKLACAIFVCDHHHHKKNPGCTTPSLAQNMFFAGTNSTMIPLTAAASDAVTMGVTNAAAVQNAVRTPPALWQYPGKCVPSSGEATPTGGGFWGGLLCGVFSCFSMWDPSWGSRAIKIKSSVPRILWIYVNFEPLKKKERTTTGQPPWLIVANSGGVCAILLPWTWQGGDSVFLYFAFFLNMTEK